ncbi:hypothetical protein KJ682_01480 [bacterium]|nr:hypothetical protein [bacterium]
MIYSAILSALLVFGSFGLASLLTSLVGDIGWPGRIGGTLVGMAVFLQGYMFANPEKFTRKLSSGITLKQRLMHIVYSATIFGTFLWAFGDLIPES